MTRKIRRKLDPLEREIEVALRPGASIPDRACYSFVSDLDPVAARLARLITEDPARAATLYESFLAACYLKVEELDDSSGRFGQFVDELYCGWLRARQAAGEDPNETAARLLDWMDEDEYGFCYRLETDLVKVLDKGNRTAFVQQVRARFDGAAKPTRRKGGSAKDRPDYVRRRLGDVLRTLYAAQKNLTAYVALAEEVGLSPQDCHVIAKLLAGRRKLEEALAWVDRGIDLGRKLPYGSPVDYDLAELKRKLLTKLGRGNEALESAWADYCRHPSEYSYEDLMRFVPRAQKVVWHAKAIDVAKKADLDTAAELLLATREIAGLIDLVDQAADEALADLSHHTAEPVARKLEKPRPDLAARLWRAQGLRIVNAGKSRYYDAALLNFESAKRCFERAGLHGQWERTVNQVRTEHHRKSGFMPAFERLAAGTGPSDEPSFMEQAKARFRERHGRAR